MELLGSVREPMGRSVLLRRKSLNARATFHETIGMSHLISVLLWTEKAVGFL